MENKKHKFVVPHTLVILLAIVLIACLLTYIVPAGEFDRAADEVSGKTLVVPGSFHAVDQSPVSVTSIPLTLYNALVAAAGMIFFVLMIGGALGILSATGATDAFALATARHLKGKEKVAIVLISFVFGLLGTTIGFGIEAVAFVPMMVAFSVSLGYDRMVGIGILMLGALGGSTAGILNPFNVGMAQTIAELPLYSGAWLRVILFFLIIISLDFYLIHYGEKVKKDPTKALLYGLPENNDEIDESVYGQKMSTRQIIVLIVFLVSLVFLVYGSAKLGWGNGEISALFFTMGIAVGIVMGYSPNRMANEFCSGVKAMAGGAIVIGFARAIQIVLTNGCIIDTIVYGISNSVVNLPVWLRGAGMYIAQTLINLVIVSSSGQATAVMPIFTPVADLVGISRQTAVLAFQLGDGFTNYLYPTCAALFVNLAAAKVSYGKWVKFYLPILGVWFLIGLAAVIFATMIGY